MLELLMSIVPMAGAVLVGAGCALMGLLSYRRLVMREKILAAWLTALTTISGEITFRLTPLPELSKKLDNPVLHGFWNYIGSHYSAYGDKSYAEVWREAACKLDLADIDKALIGDIGEILGRYDTDSQSTSLTVLRAQLEYSLEIARENKMKQGRLSGALGVLGGLILIVITV